MLSELHSRLEHLVSYSSQLIFVSGESIGQQQRTLEAFLSQQSENTEVSFITAGAQLQITDYRRQICRQLLGQVAGSFVRPLNELLASLNQHEGPVLICITQAQSLPDPFLQELWDLVLQSRFASNRQHLNVLLFGEREWAEHAKQWLPGNNTDKPLLLRSESVVAASQQQSELEQLIADKRRQFGQRLQQRAQSHPQRQPILAHWWMKVLIASVFCLSFGGILISQYFDLSLSAVDEFRRFLFQAAPQQAQQTVTPSAPTQPNILEKTTTEVASEPGSEAESSSPEQAAADNQALVTDWQSAIADLPDRTLQAPPETEAEAQVAVTEAASDKFDTPAIDSAATAALPADDQDISVMPQAERLPGEVLDYQVEDVVTVDQLPPAANSELADLPSAAAPARFDADSLLALPPDAYLLQLTGISSESLLTDYINDNQLADTVWIYRTRRFGGDWFVVLLNQRFDSLQQAREFAGQSGNSAAFAKQAGQVQQEINAAMQTAAQ